MSDTYEEVKQFLDELHATGLFSKLSRSDLEAYWMAICEFMGNRLLSDEKPVPCYLFNLVALPLRPDWRTLLTKNLSRKDWVNLDVAVSAAPNIDTEDIERLTPARLARLIDPHMLTYSRTPDARTTFGKLVYVQHRKSWRESVRRVEIHRRKVLGLAYAESAFNSIRRQKASILRLILEWRLLTRRSLVEKFLGSKGGLKRLLFGEQPVEVRPRGRPSRRAEAFKRDVERTLVTQEAVPKANGDLSAMPGIQQKTQIMRDARGRFL